jgi:hypothetical protein
MATSKPAAHAAAARAFAAAGTLPTRLTGAMGGGRRPRPNAYETYAELPRPTARATS